jgi:RimJ/RimL family protein N-acetyltransferase
VSKKFFIEGPRLFLRKLMLEDAAPSYVQWLNDPDVLRYRGPKGYPSNMADLRRFIKFAQSTNDLYLAICLKRNGKHIGGISLTSISSIHRTAELNIMIGDKVAWGKNYGQEAIAILMRHAFMNMNLNKLNAQSPNPAFNKTVKKLGWKKEGLKRQVFLLDGKYVDMECFGILKSEFKGV